MRFATVVLATLISLAAARTQANVIWNETSGDLSGDRLAPSAFVLNVGSNNLIGSVAGGELDYVALTVPAGAQLTEITLVSYASVDQVAFIGMQQGATFTEPAVGTNVANLLGYTHFGSGGAAPGTDILDNIGTGAGAQGFVPPLPAAEYTFWIQQLGSLTEYNLDFVVVPEPSSWLLAVLSAVGALTYLRKHRRLAPRLRAERAP